MNKKIFFPLLIIVILFAFSCKKKDNPNNAIVNESIEDKITNLIKRNNLEELKKVINDTNINQYNSEGLTPLLVACQNSNYEIIKFLINNNADVNKDGILQYEDMTPLIFSLKEDSNEDDLYKIVELLLVNKANINVRSSDNQTPLTLSIQKNNNKIILLLLKYNVDVNMTCCYGTTPLEIAMENNNFDIAKLLINKGADVNYFNKEMGENDSILISSVYWNKPELVKLLLDNGVDKSYKNSNGKTALDIAIEKGNEEIINLLK